KRTLLSAPTAVPSYGGQNAVYPLHHVFLLSYVQQRIHHSFPTRRSSDLLPPPRCHKIKASTASPISAGGSRFQAVHKSSGATPRSEEHTSELQSRENLVCRLLLEKKNHNHA